VSFFASFALLFVLVFRPQEVWPFLEAFRLLDLCTVLAALGLIVEFGRGQQKDPYTPQLPFLVGFVLVCYGVTTIVMGRDALVLTNGLIPALFMLVVMYGARTFIRLRAILALLLVLAGVIAAVAVHQGLNEPQCMQMVPADEGTLQVDPSTADGRPCTKPKDCTAGDRWEADWGCERLGLFDSVSVGRRVRWRGQLSDPNELSVFIGAVIPLIFGMGVSTKRKVLSVLSVMLVILGLWAVVLSQSRGGQLVVGTVFAVYFVSRYGWKGLLGAAVFALPLVLVGTGREEADADSSAEERILLLFEGVRLALSHPIIGVGKDQFQDHMSLHMTAHNAYVLAAAELGFPGFFMWTGLFWTSVKIPLTVVRSPLPTMNPDLAPVAKALLASFVGMAVGIFFLSFTYKQLLFVWFGIAGALHGVLKSEDPNFEVKLGIKDFLGVAVADVAILAFIFVYSKFKVS
jgi:hypothetical protein